MGKTNENNFYIRCPLVFTTIHQTEYSLLWRSTLTHKLYMIYRYMVWHTLHKKVKDVCQYLDLNTKIKANSRSCTKKNQIFKNILNFFFVVHMVGTPFGFDIHIFCKFCNMINYQILLYWMLPNTWDHSSLLRSVLNSSLKCYCYHSNVSTLQCHILISPGGLHQFWSEWSMGAEFYFQPG